MVSARGGRLYLWSEPLGEAFERPEAGTVRPSGVEFSPYAGEVGFELFVEDGMTWRRKLHLGRRWFGLRDGVTVSTALHLN